MRAVGTLRGPGRDLEVGGGDDPGLQDNSLTHAAAIVQVFAELFPVHPGSHREARIFERRRAGNLSFAALPSVFKRRVRPGKVRQKS